MEYYDEDKFPEDESINSEDEDLYPEDDDSYESDRDFAEKPSSQKSEEAYRVLQEADVKQLQHNAVESIYSALSLSKDEALKLLYYYKWNESLLLDEWFDDEERARKKVGLLSSPTEFRFTGQLTLCGICFESFPLDHEHFYPTVCGHPYCVMCWKDYLSVSIKDGLGCLSLRCPEPKCRAVVVDQEMIDKLCSHAFCWNCVEEVHRPVDCKTVAKWVLKNSSEAENTEWIIANSKPCPKCKKSIEKNQGCMHMTCRCGFEFCWLCLGQWSEHGSGTGGYDSCNIYEASSAQHVPYPGFDEMRVQDRFPTLIFQ